MKERLRQVIEYLGISTRKFEQEICVSSGKVQRYLSNNIVPSVAFLEQIAVRYAELNLDWLITGRGSMFYKNDGKNAILQHSESQVFEILLKKNEDLIRANQSLEQQVDELSKKVAQLKSASASMEHSTL